jgi:hypothetical protein
MMCKGLSVRVYMPGRCLTGSKPLSTRIEPSEYAEGVAELAEAAVLAFMRGIVERTKPDNCIYPQIFIL